MTVPKELAETIARLETLGCPPGGTISPLALQISAQLGKTKAAPTTVSPRRLPRVGLGEGSDPSADLEFLRPIGEGGMGRVDLALQHVFERHVAIKRVRTDRVCVPAVQALVHEAMVTGHLDHPNIVPAHLFGQTPDGELLLVMKLIDGVSWHTLLSEPSHPAWRGNDADRTARHIEILIDVCNAVEFAHRRGIVHRDLKPANVMVGELGEVYLIDWGVAVRLSGERSSDLAGTPVYMAPEMLRGSVDVGPRTDVYLLGAILHEVLTTYPPHRGESLPQVIFSIASGEPVEFDVSVPSELAAICRRALARDPAQRFESAIALRDALTEHLQHRSSMELAAQGEASLAALRQEVGGGLDEEEARTSARRHATEAEFAFQQALRAWPSNVEATALRSENLELRVELELALRNGPGAQVLLGEFASPPAELARRVADLIAELEEGAEAKGELARLKREGDFQASEKTPIVLLVVMCTLGGGCGLLLDVLGAQLTNGGLFAFWTALTVAGLLVRFVARKRLYVNQANRSVQTSTIMMAGWLIVGASVAWALDLPPAVTLGLGYLMMGAMTMQLAIWSERSIGVYVLMTPVAALGLWLWPDHLFRAIALICFSIVPMAGLRLWFRRREAGAS